MLDGCGHRAIRGHTSSSTEEVDEIEKMEADRKHSRGVITNAAYRFVFRGDDVRFICPPCSVEVHIPEDKRDMIEELQHGLITYNAWVKKYKNFMCDTHVEMYVNDVLEAEERFTPPSQRIQH